ncbi:ribonucleases P/MRP protein subunit POP1-domain-containing protein [Whalleya microplaca]|nr:ribonucleases P/MRP protein subunit POP1-domain-containing protein [Whalleya microplaca]
MQTRPDQMPPKTGPQARPGEKSAGKSGSMQKPRAAPGSAQEKPAQHQSTKRKDPPQQDGGSKKPGKGPQPPDTRAAKRARTRDTRTIAAQESHAALKDGELHVQSFVNSLSFEMNALDESMRRTRTSNVSRAFQRVPFTMRRRAAAHNYKRIPKRLHKRAKREMAEDNTPMVNTKTRKPKSTRSRLRAQTVKRLEILAKRKRLLKLKRSGADKETISIRAARPKIQRNALNSPLVTAARYRKRQISKTWLPTHIWHTKRARMTPPEQPLWRFAIPLTPTQKIYRPTHRAQWQKGAMAWDMSYMSTIGLSGPQNSVQNVLKSLGLTQEALWNDKAQRWRAGCMHWTGTLSRKKLDTVHVIGPATIIWNPEKKTDDAGPSKHFRQVFIRIHPSAFMDVFNELIRLVKMQTPRPYIQDLRFEIGSIDITGPESTEALLGILRPYYSKPESKEPHASKFESLNCLKDPSSLPVGALLAFSIMDPRLHYPPRRITPSHRATDESAQAALLEAIAKFRKDESIKPHQLFDRDARFRASRLPSQKSLNRRRGKGAPGAVLEPTLVDPPIPVMLLASRHSIDAQESGTWTLMLPWKCVLPVWYSLMHFPLSAGGNPLFGGLNEIRQLAFERSLPWFPGDLPGTHAGQAWELQERDVRRKTWERMPKGKRVNWETLDLGAGRKGEVGIGWNCDFEMLLGLKTANEPEPKSTDPKDGDKEPTVAATKDLQKEKESQEEPINPLESITYLPKAIFNTYQSPKSKPLPQNSIISVNIKLLGRGVPTTCARIYRLPAAASVAISTQAEVPATDPPPVPKTADKLPGNLREQWLARLPSKPLSHPHPHPNAKRGINHPKKPAPMATDLEARAQLLAQQLLAPPSAFPPAPANAEGIHGGHPLCPSEADLLGFVTAGSFSLRDGRGDGVGSLSAARALEELGRNPRDPAARLCVVRNAGQNVGWLGRWDVI